MEYTGYNAKKTILNALSELLENKFIARGSNPYHYFINPTIFFNGDRLIFLEQYEVAGKEKIKKEKLKTGNEDKKPIEPTLFE
jgi:hypothetical protein